MRFAGAEWFLRRNRSEFHIFKVYGESHDIQGRKALWSITLCALSVLPSQASVTSQYACLSSSCENIVWRLLWWYFHLRQYCWGNMLDVAVGGVPEDEPLRCCNMRKLGTTTSSPPPSMMLRFTVSLPPSTPVPKIARSNQKSKAVLPYPYNPWGGFSMT